MEDLPCVLLGLGFGPRAAFESVVFVEAKRLGGFRVWGKIVGPPMHFARCVFGSRAAFESVVFVEAKRLGGFPVWGKNVGPPMRFARSGFWRALT